MFVFFFKQKTAYEMRISDWSSDVCSSDLFGMPMGPFQMSDLAGVDIGWHRDPNRIESIRDALAAEGRWGQKKRAGFYDYDDKRNPQERESGVMGKSGSVSVDNGGTRITKKNNRPKEQYREHKNKPN